MSLPTFTGLSGGGARCRATITRTQGSPSPHGSQPPSNRSTVSPVFILLTLVVGGRASTPWIWGCVFELVSPAPRDEVNTREDDLNDTCCISILSVQPHQSYSRQESKGRQ